ncbi:MAG: hypothetical protein RI973_1065 [Bacteroidota bacterium]|jgi:hypothetical protein
MICLCPKTTALEKSSLYEPVPLVPERKQASRHYTLTYQVFFPNRNVTLQTAVIQSIENFIALTDDSAGANVVKKKELSKNASEPQRCIRCQKMKRGDHSRSLNSSRVMIKQYVT